MPAHAPFAASDDSSKFQREELTRAAEDSPPRAQPQATDDLGSRSFEGLGRLVRRWAFEHGQFSSASGRGDDPASPTPTAPGFEGVLAEGRAGYRAFTNSTFSRDIA